jgi:hypothetical protein
MGIPAVRVVLKRRTLSKRGQQIEGEITRCSSFGDSESDFKVEVGFGFRSPQTGTWIKGKDSKKRKDLWGKPLPAPGTPVHVLYLDDENYVVL